MDETEYLRQPKYDDEMQRNKRYIYFLLIPFTQNIFACIFLLFHSANGIQMVKHTFIENIKPVGAI